MNQQSIKTVEATETTPWEIQPGETAGAYEAFCIYRDLGRDRKVSEVAKRLNKSAVTMNRLSQKYGWVERCRAWTAELDRKKREAYVRETEEMIKRHCNESKLFQTVLILPVKALLKKMEKEGEKAKSFNNASVSTLYDKALKAAQVFSNIIGIERISRGESTEFVKQDVTSGGKEIKVILPTPPPNRED